MTHAADLPAWAAWIVALLLLFGAGITLIGSIGLLRLRGFYQRAHAPTLGTTLGTAFIVAASMLCFSLLQMRPLLHEVLILGFVTITTPVTLMLLVRAALFRDTAEGRIDDVRQRAKRKPRKEEPR
ncbi:MULTISPECIES: monovalent cation/H(+) antiporter subunit G [Rhodopseudomonas]|jgi:multicomponent K+:H+ antiporter subunit G|uniref:monovalent cation/H(+) antiporter subunit G n=1 Tax=Rhodopseudomonas TaxID=1073 RepID=UPI000D1A1B3F|nr:MULTISPECIES: monovalent cation/H(+) antiporter subunit G [Rhodopseudomonas]AVT76897.1 potassium, proton antiporter [Rhodopseudomonas palustris]NEW95246.1 potassium:proton antiporter [Rhodopseudomonas sp. BR0G17]